MADAKVIPTAAPEEVEKLRAEQEQEWGTYVAIAPISFNGTPAYNVGDPVPVSNVKRHGYGDDLVAKVGNKAAQDVISALHESNQNQAQAEVAPPVSLGVPVK